MKRLLMAGFLLGVFAGVAQAWPEDNPDKYPSIGLSYTGIETEGDLTYMSSGFSARQDVESSLGIIMVDARFPVSRNITLHGGIGSVGTEATAKETNLLDGGKNDESGVAVNLGIRFYIH